MGGLKATKEVAELYHIDKNSCVLEVGCNVGLTACYIAREYNCKWIAINISEEILSNKFLYPRLC